MNKLIASLLSHRELVLESKKENPHVKAGYHLLSLSLALLAGGFLFNLNVEFINSKIMLQLDTQAGHLVMAFGLIVGITALVLLKGGLANTRKLWNSKVFYYLKGLDNQSDDLPFYALSNMAKWYSPNPVKLTIHSDILESMYTDLQFSQKAIMEKVSQYNSQEVFFAGIARVPCLFFIGYAFRNAHSTITLLDHDHKSDKWFSLKHTDDAHIDTIIESPILNHNGRVPNISVIIEFTCEIPIHDLPIGLQDQTVKIKLSNGYTHNQTTSKETVERIVNAIVQQLIILNKKCDRLHLFIAAQSTIAFSLGRRYQDGMIGNITVYNYDAVKKTYSWAISLINNKMELEKFE